MNFHVLNKFYNNLFLKTWKSFLIIYFNIQDFAQVQDFPESLFHE